MAGINQFLTMLAVASLLLVVISSLWSPMLLTNISAATGELKVRRMFSADTALLSAASVNNRRQWPALDEKAARKRGRHLPAVEPWSIEPFFSPSIHLVSRLFRACSALDWPG